MAVRGPTHNDTTGSVAVPAQSQRNAGLDETPEQQESLKPPTGGVNTTPFHKVGKN